MKKRKVTILVVEDDRTQQSNAFVLEVKIAFENIIFKETTNEALTFVKDNLETKIIILLDLAFPTNQMQGIKFLEELRNLSKLIPVIVWSAKGSGSRNDSITDTEYQKMINDTTFAFLSKSASSAEIIEKLNNAVSYMDSQLDSAVESWLENHTEEEKNKPFLATSNGHSYSMNDLLKEIRRQTQFGQSITLDINKLTLDLLFRNKEKLW